MSVVVVVVLMAKDMNIIRNVGGNRQIKSIIDPYQNLIVWSSKHLALGKWPFGYYGKKSRRFSYEMYLKHSECLKKDLSTCDLQSVSFINV